MSARTQSAGPLIQSGTLFLVATPIGNLSDLTDRAREVLAAVDVVAAEDTRHTGQLLKSFGISKPLVSVHEHNESVRATELIQRMIGGTNVALVSDAGTPLISDPGFDVVRAAIAADVKVVAVPGACAAIAALSVAGLPTDRFSFEGFLPAKEKQRRQRLSELSRNPRTLIFYESPHRLIESLQAIVDSFGPTRRIAVVRELTKQFETIYRGTAKELATRALQDADMSRGELVLVIEGCNDEAVDSPEADRILGILLSELAPAQAAKLATKITSVDRDTLYRRALELTERR